MEQKSITQTKPDPITMIHYQVNGSL